MLYRVLETFAVGQRRFRAGMEIDHTELEAESPVVPVSQWALLGLIEQPEAGPNPEPAEVAVDALAEPAETPQDPVAEENIGPDSA